MNDENIIVSAYKDSLSITHRHIISVINSMVKYEQALQGIQTIRILDAGCGDGNLLNFLNKYLPLFNTGKQFLLYGYDVSDHGVQQSDYIKKTYSYLYNNAPEINWSDRIRLIKSDDNWPFENETFDIVISNQVLEHVWDHNHFFRENNRVLSPRGFSVHLFPVKEVFFDGHVFLPFVHQLKSWDAIYRKVKFYSSLGLGLYKKEKQLYNNDLNNFSRVWADKIYHFCNYPSYAELGKAVKNNNLCLTTRYTYHYYWRKLNEIFGKKPPLIYNKTVSSKVMFYLLKHISGVSIVLYKGEYSKY